MNKKILAAGLAAGLIAGGGAGLALAVSGGNDGGSIAAADIANGAQNDGMSMDDHASHLAEILQPLVDDGTLTQAQADAVIAALEAAGPMGGRGHEMRGHGPGGRFGLYGIEGSPLAVVADTLGLTEDEVRTAVEGGQTIAELAVANGSSAQAVIDALVAEVTAHLDAEVAAGEHTQDEADARLADATTAITDFVNNTPTMPMGGGRHGDDIDGDDDVTSDTTA